MEEKYQKLLEIYEWDIEGILDHLLEETKKEQLLVNDIKETLTRKKIIIENHKNLIDSIMKKTGQTKRESAIGMIKYTKWRPLELDESKVTEDYKEVVETVKIDKLKIKADLKAGIPLDWAKLWESQTLSIK